MGIWDKAKKADSNYSVASWIPTTLQFLFPASFAAAIGWAASYRDWIWTQHGMLGVLALGLAGFLIAGLAVFISGHGAAAWSHAQSIRQGKADSTSLKTSQDAPSTKNIAAVRLVPSGEEMCLVVTPLKGGVTISIFADISHWTPSLIPSDWSASERFFLGEMPLRAANVKFSLPVMDRGPDKVGWLWRILKSDGTISGTQPWFVHGRQRVVFSFISPGGIEEQFPLLLVQSAENRDAHPVVVTQSDLPPLSGHNG
jgi:hypothetical protein